MLKINKKLLQKGFTLIEVMIAVSILGMASLGIFQSYRAGFWGMSDAKMRTIATNIAQEKLEEVKGKSLAAGTYPDPDNPIVVSGKDFNAEVTVEDVYEGSPPLPTTLKKIITTVSWQKRNGEDTQISIENLQSTALAPPSEDVPTAILVSANPTSINVGDTSSIKVTILDQDNYPISYNGQIDLSRIPTTLGNLDDPFLNFNGDSYLFTTFRANTVGDAGDVQIKAEDHLDSDGLIDDSDTITIIGGEAAKINLMVDPSSIIINGDTSTLTVRIEDENGFLAANWTGIVQLTITSGQNTGDLGNPPAMDTIPINFNEENVKTTLFTSSDQEGVAVVEAIDLAGELTEDSDTINVTSGPPYQIDIEAEPKSIFIQGYEDGPTSSTITVTIKNETGVAVSGFVGTIALSLLSGSESGSLATNTLIFNGQNSLSTTFASTGTPGMVEIKAQDTTSGGVGYVPLIPDTDMLTVAAGPPDHLEITAIPDMILNNGIEFSTLTIELKDISGNYSSFDEDRTLTFSLSPSEGMVNNTINNTLTLPAGHSQISTTYICANSGFEGDVDITVNCEGITGGRTVTVQVVSRIIRPAEEPNIQYGGSWVHHHHSYVWKEDKSKVLFDIDVLGGTIEITQIDLAWKESPPSEDLRGITIYEQGNSYNVKIRKTWSSRHDPLIPIYPSFYEITGFNPHQDLIEGAYTVELEYDRNILDRTIIIQFHGTYLNKEYIYQMEFLSPDMIV